MKTTLKAEINADAWESLHSDTSRPFDKPTSEGVYETERHLLYVACTRAQDWLLVIGVCR